MYSLTSLYDYLQLQLWLGCFWILLNCRFRCLNVQGPRPIFIWTLLRYLERNIVVSHANFVSVIMLLKSVLVLIFVFWCWSWSCTIGLGLCLGLAWLILFITLATSIVLGFIAFKPWAYMVWQTARTAVIATQTFIAAVNYRLRKADSCQMKKWRAMKAKVFLRCEPRASL